MRHTLKHITSIHDEVGMIAGPVGTKGARRTAEDIDQFLSFVRQPSCSRYDRSQKRS
jgi:hypothetical protein